VAHARNFSWDRTAQGLLAVYRDATLSTVDLQLAALNGTTLNGTTMNGTTMNGTTMNGATMNGTTAW
jgi:uncharacterized protein YjbI with pentapeptide repeats